MNYTKIQLIALIGLTAAGLNLQAMDIQAGHPVNGASQTSAGSTTSPYIQGNFSNEREDDIKAPLIIPVSCPTSSCKGKATVLEYKDGALEFDCGSCQSERQVGTSDICPNARCKNNRILAIHKVGNTWSVQCPVCKTNEETIGKIVNQEGEPIHTPSSQVTSNRKKLGIGAAVVAGGAGIFGLHKLYQSKKATIAPLIEKQKDFLVKKYNALKTSIRKNTKNILAGTIVAIGLFGALKLGNVQTKKRFVDHCVRPIYRMHPAIERKSENIERLVPENTKFNAGLSITAGFLAGLAHKKLMKRK